MKRYALVYTQAVFDFILVQRKRVREGLMLKLDQIRAFPEASSEFVEPGSHGRLVDGCRVGGFNIYYWIDHTEEEIKVIGIERRRRV